MGSAFYSLSETQRRLNKSRASVYSYVQKGFLKKYHEDGKQLFSKEEVDDLAQRQGVDAPAMTRAAWLEMQGRLRKLEDEMRLVKHILELRDTQPLRPDKASAQAIYAAMQTYLANASSITEAKSIDNWAMIFETTDERTLDLISEYVDDKAVWMVVYRTCMNLSEYCQAQNAASPSILWQTLAQRLEQCRQRLRLVAIAWLKLGRGSLPTELLTLFDSKKESLIRQIAKPIIS